MRENVQNIEIIADQSILPVTIKLTTRQAFPRNCPDVLELRGGKRYSDQHTRVHERS